MSSLKCLFIIQGEGRGHMTQALALRSILARAGHEVCGVLLGRNTKREVPGFFLRKIEADVGYFDSFGFKLDANDKSIHLLASLLHNVQQAGRYRQSLRVIDRQIRRQRPDVVVNFFEPMTGLYYALYRPAVPLVCVAHQYMFHHAHYPFPEDQKLQRYGMKGFTHLTALGASRRLALSIYDAEDLPKRRLAVVPPLLRDELFRQPRGRREPFLLIYLLNSGYAEEVIRWHQRHPEVALHCFWDRQGADPVEVFDETLSFHQLDDEKFLDLMARCSGVVTTAGFESMSEAMYLGKPLLMVPVRGHFEQRCNALDGVAAGAGIYADHFDLSRLLDFLPAYEDRADTFRRWVGEAEERFVREIEDVARAPAQTTSVEV